MARIILTTCGLTILETARCWKGYSDKPGAKPRGLDPQPDRADAQCKRILKDFHKKPDSFAEGFDIGCWNPDKLGFLSAEMASLYLINEQYFGNGLGEKEIVYLIHGDDEEGKLVYAVHEAIFKKIAFQPQIKPMEINNLDPRSANDFCSALNVKLLSAVEKIIINSDNEFYLNLTGGYKGVLIFLGMKLGRRFKQIFYLFEKSSELIKLLNEDTKEVEVVFIRAIGA